MWALAVGRFRLVRPLLPSALSPDPSRATSQGSLTWMRSNAASTTRFPGRYGLVKRRSVEGRLPSLVDLAPLVTHRGRYDFGSPSLDWAS